MKRIFAVAIGIVFLVVLSGTAQAADPQASMYTLDNIYYYLAEGTEASWGAHSLEPQSGIPGQDIPGFTKSLEDIYYYMSDAFGKCDLTPDMVDDEYYFFCVDTNYWGVQEGTIPIPTPTPTPWTLNETNCNALTGWKWIDANDGGSCWSKTLAYSVSWNKGVGADSDNPGAYTCASGYSLQQRMDAAAAGEWYKIVETVSGHTMLTNGTEDGQSGATYISALAIADCVDGTRDLCSTDGCLGTSRSTIDTALRTWASAANKSALCRLTASDGATQITNDYYDACVDLGTNDVHCTGVAFYLNRKACTDTGDRYCWAAACASPNGDQWANGVRVLGGTGLCNVGNRANSDATDTGLSFRVVVRPSE